MEKITLNVTGMHCKSCVRNIINGLADIGVAEATACNETGIVEATFDAAVVTVEQIKQKITDIGFGVA